MLPPGAGTAEWIYRLTHRGWRVLDDHGQATATKLQLGEVTDLAYVSHDLQLDATLLHVADRAYPGPAPLCERLPFAWHGPELGRVERDGGGPPARRSPFAFLPDGHTMRPGRSFPGVLEPDATLIGTHALSDPEFPESVAILFEYDRTRRASKQRDRRERLNAGIWDMEAVPDQPPDVRNSKVVHPRATPAPVMRVFQTGATRSAASP